MCSGHGMQKLDMVRILMHRVDTLIENEERIEDRGEGDSSVEDLWVECMGLERG